MKHVIAIGQTYQHEDGDEYEVVKVSRDRVTFETSDDAIVHMGLDDLMKELDEGALFLSVYADTEGDGDDEDEED